MTTFILQNQRLQLRADRTLFWPAQQVLLAADLHLGKGETFQNHGLAVPSGSDAADLARLGAALRDTQAERLILLGDMVHAKAGFTAEVRRAFATWRTTHATVDMTLIRGNHDHFLDLLPPEWHMHLIDDALIEPPFCYRHEPEPSPDGYILAGHVHPVIRLRGGGDALRLPCFHFGPKVGILPAFSSFAGGWAVKPTRKDQVFAIAEEEVIDLR